MLVLPFALQYLIRMGFLRIGHTVCLHFLLLSQSGIALLFMTWLRSDGGEQ